MKLLGSTGTDKLFWDGASFARSRGKFKYREISCKRHAALPCTLARTQAFP